jgi:hypothetical protein
VRNIDFVDAGLLALLRMQAKRYRIEAGTAPDEHLL